MFGFEYVQTLQWQPVLRGETETLRVVVRRRAAAGSGVPVAPQLLAAGISRCSPRPHVCVLLVSALNRLLGLVLLVSFSHVLPKPTLSL